MSNDMNTDMKHMLNKVPQVSLVFWIIKIMATTVGETAADFLNVKLHLGLTGTSGVMGLLLAGALLLQFRSRRYVPWIYWLTVVLISVFGTLVTDNLVDNFGIALETTSILFSAALLVTFVAWFAAENTISIHTISTTRRETFYWIVILFTFALGTSAGDLAAEGLNMGYALSAAAFGGLILLTTICYYRFHLNSVAAFWIAYILTRPFGASCGDLLSQPVANGGLGLGIIGTNVFFLGTILGLVTFLSLGRHQEAVEVEAD